jgi:hypothetical protein
LPSANENDYGISSGFGETHHPMKGQAPCKAIEHLLVSRENHCWDDVGVCAPEGTVSTLSENIFLLLGSIGLNTGKFLYDCHHNQTKKQAPDFL